jgi:uncharacterized protein (DUF1499 family)
MMTLAIIAVLVIAAAIGYLLLDKRPNYGAYYGLAKLAGSRLDIGPVDFARLARHATPNDALVCPTERCPYAKPDVEPKIYSVPAAQLLARVRTIARVQPRISELSCEPNCDRVARFVQRTLLMRFPDTIDVEAFPAGENRSTLAIYSRSLVGRKDFGVNRARVERWLAALD